MIFRLLLVDGVRRSAQIMSHQYIAPVAVPLPAVCVAIKGGAESPASPNGPACGLDPRPLQSSPADVPTWRPLGTSSGSSLPLSNARGANKL